MTRPPAAGGAPALHVAFDFTYGTQLSGAVGLTKLGAGTGGLVLTGMNTYTGATTVSSGTLIYPLAFCGLVAIAAIGLRHRNVQAVRRSIGNINRPRVVFSSSASIFQAANPSLQPPLSDLPVTGA